MVQTWGRGLSVLGGGKADSGLVLTVMLEAMGEGKKGNKGGMGRERGGSRQLDRRREIAARTMEEGDSPASSALEGLPLGGLPFGGAADADGSDMADARDRLEPASSTTMSGPSQGRDVGGERAAGGQSRAVVQEVTLAGQSRASECNARWRGLGQRELAGLARGAATGHGGRAEGSQKAARACQSAVWGERDGNMPSVVEESGWSNQEVPMAALRAINRRR